MGPIRWLAAVVAAAVGAVVFFAAIPDAHAVPSFARKYQTSCSTCHTVYPVLNPFGEAFRRDGYRFPSQSGSVDSDAVKSPMIALGQEEYIKTFPDSVWPDKIADSVPLSVMANGSLALYVPDSDANENAGHTFTWGGIQGEFHLFGAGSFNDSLTYFTQVTLVTAGTLDIETGYLLWNDVVGPRHLVNLWIGRLMGPQLTSFGLHGSYMTDTILPAVSVAGLYNPSANFTLGQGHTDGAELNGIVAHRVGWSLGWAMSSAASGLQLPNAEDFYAHVGIKSGGVALDGEGKYGPNVPDPRKPWAEKAVTLDLFAYHGNTFMDNATGTAPAVVGQNDRFNAAGASVRAQYDSLIATAGVQAEAHDSPYQGAGTPAAPDFHHATSVVQYDEIDYVVWPWFVPGVRAEFTRTSVEGGVHASLLRIIPGIAMLVRPNIKVVLSGDIEQAYGLPFVGSWGPASGNLRALAGPYTLTQFEAQQINATVAFAY